MAARQVVLADHTKWGKLAFATIAPVTRAHMLISNKQFDAGAARELRARGYKF